MKLIYLVFLFGLLFNNGNSEDTLVFLYTHFRHGARAPLNLDNNFNDMLNQHWTNPGELTGIGQRMHYLLGLRNRIRYIKNQNFLSEKFDSHQILIYSSNLNRTMVSCSSQLQGLYPQKDLKGETLTSEQQKIAFPQVNVSDSEIQDAIEDLENNSLPNSMIIAPVRMINDNDKKMNVYDLEECIEERNERKRKNRETIPIISEETKNFNDKYGEKLNQFFNSSDKEYSFPEINDICDSFLSSYYDNKNLSNFESVGINLTEFDSYCWAYYRISYLYEFCGDEDKELAHVDSSKIMRELVYYIKRRLDADITLEDEDSNLSDYSRPRWLMTSGHDSTVSMDQIFLFNALGSNETELYTFPRYSSQLALEVKKSKNNTSSYSDYYVNGFFDDKELFNVSADEFLEKVQKYVWSDEKVDEYCGFNEN